MEHEFVNIYINKLLNEITELTKNKILLQSQLEFSETINKNLLKQIESLEEKNKKKINKKEDTF